MPSNSPTAMPNDATIVRRSLAYHRFPCHSTGTPFWRLGVGMPSFSGAQAKEHLLASDNRNPFVDVLLCDMVQIPSGCNELHTILDNSYFAQARLTLVLGDFTAHWTHIISY